MKTLVLLLLVPYLALAAVSRDGSHGGAPQQSQPGPTYDVPPPPPPPSFEPSQYEYQAQPHPQFNYQPNYVDSVWDVGPLAHEETFLGSWVDKALKVLSDVVPVALSVIIVITILTFLGLVNIPILKDFSETREQLGRTLANLDVDQLANTVSLAIDKYNELFGQ